MGREKEKMMENEHNERKFAKARGDICYIGSEPLLTAKEKASGICIYHASVIKKDDEKYD